jgi:cytochrome c biogenesis protein CcmG/thiol:disulfide interchange protein DsbE
MRRIALTLACIAFVAGCGSDEPRSAARAGDRPAGAPPKLAKLNDQANRLLDGGLPAFQARLRELRGYPVVVNMWGSWCPPCRAEFPYLQKQALKHGAEVAFLGINSQDPESAAREFLEEYPVPFPSYKDPDLKLAAEIAGAVAFPITVFYDKRGRKAYVHQGGYATEAKLAEDIERYAL